jgi:hypothetical protein
MIWRRRWGFRFRIFWKMGLKARAGRAGMQRGEGRTGGTGLRVRRPVAPTTAGGTRYGCVYFKMIGLLFRD